jgi:hypothetical protein
MNTDKIKKNMNMEVKEEFPRQTKDQYWNKKLGKMSHRRKEEHGKNP